MAPLHNKAFRHSFPFLSHPCPEEQSQQACSGAERRLSEPSIAHGVTIDEFPGHPARITDFFSSDTFNRVLHDPAVSNQFYLFSKAQNCAENVHFIRKVREQRWILIIGGF